MKRVFLAVLVLAACAAPVLASQAIVDLNGTEAMSGNDNRDMGWEFTPTVNITVTKLGAWDWCTSRGYTQEQYPMTTHDVAIYDLGGTQLAVATVGPTGTLGLDNYRFVDIASLHLTGGTTYVIMAGYHSAGQDYGPIWQATGRAMAPEIALGAGRITGDQANDGAVSFGTTSVGWNGPYMPNFQYEVPEPATMGLLGLGLAGMIIRRKK